MHSGIARLIFSSPVHPVVDGNSNGVTIVKSVVAAARLILIHVTNLNWPIFSGRKLNRNIGAVLIESIFDIASIEHDFIGNSEHQGFVTGCKAVSKLRSQAVA